MRAYFFGNMYLSSIAQGIQSGHCISEIFIKYQQIPSLKIHQVNDWAINHKTTILLNGGYHESIVELTEFFADNDNNHPWAPFFESEEALGGIQTTVGIILPEYIYQTAKNVRDNHNDWTGIIDSSDKQKSTFTVHKNIPNVNGLSYPAAHWIISKWELQLIDRLNTYGLAK
jgi:hypothetical protein